MALGLDLFGGVNDMDLSRHVQVSGTLPALYDGKKKPTKKGKK